MAYYSYTPKEEMVDILANAFKKANEELTKAIESGSSHEEEIARAKVDVLTEVLFEIKIYEKETDDE